MAEWVMQPNGRRTDYSREAEEPTTAGQPRQRAALLARLFVVAKCDAVLRIGGASVGADEMVALGREPGKAVYFSVGAVPAV